MASKQHNQPHGPKPLIRQPGPWADQVEAASERDRMWFEQHPGRDRYVRKRMPGEYGPHEGEEWTRQATHTEVQQLAPGYRQRSPIVLLQRKDYPGNRVPFEHFEAAVEHLRPRLEDLRAYTDDEIVD